MLGWTDGGKSRLGWVKLGLVIRRCWVGPMESTVWLRSHVWGRQFKQTANYLPSATRGGENVEKNTKRRVWGMVRLPWNQIQNSAKKAKNLPPGSNLIKNAVWLSKRNSSSADRQMLLLPLDQQASCSVSNNTCFCVSARRWLANPTKHTQTHAVCTQICQSNGWVSIDRSVVAALPSTTPWPVHK